MGESFQCSSGGAHRSDHIRDFIMEHRDKSFGKYANSIGISSHTISNYVYGYNSTAIDIVGAILNEMGYTLKAVPLERR